jgi:hypothetical protein
MFLTTKEYVFFALIFVILFFFGKTVAYMQPKVKMDTTISFLLIAFFVSLLLVLVFKAGKIVDDCPKTEGFHFALSPEKLCKGGPYMISSAPKEVKDYCNKLWETEEGMREYEISNYGPSLKSGGIPKHLRTPMSNDKWENEMCA